MIKKVVYGTLAYSIENRKRLVQVTILPIALSVGLESLFYTSNSMILNLLVTCVTSFLSVLIAVNVHRVVLCGDDSVPLWGRFSVGKMEIWFILHSVALAALFLPFVLLMNVSNAAIFLGVVLLLIMPRLSLVFPAICTGKGASFGFSWQLSKGHTAELISIFIFLLLILSIILVPIISIIAFIGSSVIIPSLVSQLLAILMIVGLSLSYHEITNRSASESVVTANGDG